MGLLGLLFLPFTGPFKGVLFVAEHIAAEAEMTLYDEKALKAALLELELLFQDGQVSEEGYTLAQEQLMERLAEALRRRQAQGPSERK